MSVAGVWQFLRVERPNFVFALMVMFLDGAFLGVVGFSVLVCPIWLVVLLVASIIQRPGWGHALFRVVLPVATFGLVWLNSGIQDRVAEAHARQVIAACDHYHDDYGEYPQRLDDLVPTYLGSIPVAKYNLSPGSRFLYFNNGEATIYWHKYLLLRKFFNLETRRWSYLD